MEDVLHQNIYVRVGAHACADERPESNHELSGQACLGHVVSVHLLPKGQETSADITSVRSPFARFAGRSRAVP